MSLEPGTGLGPYQIVSRLGNGGMGEVYGVRPAPSTNRRDQAAVAEAHPRRGLQDAVFEWLDKAVDEGTGLPCIWASFPWSDPVRSDARFDDFLRRLNLAPQP